MKITEAIALEHGTLLSVFDEVECALPALKSAAEVNTMALMLERLLETHGAQEDMLAFLPLDEALYQQGHPNSMRHDHLEVDERFREVRRAGDCEQARQLLRAAMQASREHFRQEERELFPELERVLGPGALTDLGKAFQKDREANPPTASVATAAG